VHHRGQQTIEAGLQAGLQTVHIVAEPVAAAIFFIFGAGRGVS
jgi:molecular chaperone DnaK (HSP70)